MSYRAPSICKRRGCANGRERWQFVCGSCWADVPFAERQRYLRAARAKLTRIKNEIAAQILRALGRKPAEALAPANPAPVEAYARNCALLGEREELDGKN